MFKYRIQTTVITLFIVISLSNLWCGGSLYPPHGIEVTQDRFRNVPAISEETNTIYVTSFGLEPYRISPDELEATDAMLAKFTIQNSIQPPWLFSSFYSATFDGSFQFANIEYLPPCGINAYSYDEGNDFEQMRTYFGEEKARARYDGGAGSWASPVLDEENDLLIVLNKSGVLMCIDPEFSTPSCVLWSVDLREEERLTFPDDHFIHEFMATPTILDDYVYVAGIYNICKIDLQNVYEPEFIQVIFDSEDHLVAPIAFNLYDSPNRYIISTSYNGELIIINENNMNLIVESTTLGTNSHITSKPLVDADGQVYIAADNEKIFYFSQESLTTTEPLNIMEITCEGHSFISTLIADSTNTILALTKNNDILKFQESYNFANHPNSVIEEYQWDNLFTHLNINHRVINNHSVLLEKYSFNTSCLLSIYNDGVNPLFINDNYYNNFNPEVYDIIIRMNNTLDENGGTFYETISQTATFGGIAPYVSSLNKTNALWLDENGYVYTWTSHAPTMEVDYPESDDLDPLIPKVGNPKFMKGMHNVTQYEQCDFTLTIANQIIDDFDAFYLNSYHYPSLEQIEDDLIVTFQDILIHPNYTLAILPVDGNPIIFENIEISNVNNNYEFVDEIVISFDTIWESNNLLCNNIIINPDCTLSIDGGVITVLEDVKLYNESILDVYNDGVFNVLGSLISERLNTLEDEPGIITNGTSNNYGFINVNNVNVEASGNFEIRATQNGDFQLIDFTINEGGEAKLIRNGDGLEPICNMSGEMEIYGSFENSDIIQFQPGSSCTVLGSEAEFIVDDGIVNLDNAALNIEGRGRFELIENSELNLSNASVVKVTGSPTDQDAELFLEWGSTITGCTPTTYEAAPPGYPAGAETPIPGDRIIAENGGIITTKTKAQYLQSPGNTITIKSLSGELWDGIFIKNPDQDATYWFVNCDISGIRKLSIENINESQYIAELKLYKTDFYNAGQIVVRDGHLLYIHGEDGDPDPTYCNIYGSNSIPITAYESMIDISFCDIYSNDYGIYVYDTADSGSTINNSKLHHNNIVGVKLDRANISFYENEIHNNDYFGLLAYPGTIFSSDNMDEQFDNITIYDNGNAGYVGWPSTFNMSEQRTGIEMGDGQSPITPEDCFLMNVGWNNTLDPVDIKGIRVHSWWVFYEIENWINDEGYVNLDPPDDEPWFLGNEISDEKLLLYSAMYDIGIANYSNAESSLQTIIATYSATQEAGTAVYYLYHLENLSDQDFSELIEYLEGISAEPETSLEKAIKDIITKSHMKDKNYIAAIDRLEYVIENSQDPDEVILAMIDEGYCYMQLVDQGERALPEKCTIRTATLDSYQPKVKELESQLSFFPEDNGNNIIPAGKISKLSNYPNPFNPTTTIAFDLSSEAVVTIAIYNIKGQKVKQLLSEQLATGSHTVKWSGEDNSNKSVASGIYFCKISTSKDTDLKKMLLLK